VHPPPPGEVRPLDPGNRPAGGPLRPRIPHRGDHLVRPVSADLPLRPAGLLLQLLQERIDHPRPARRRARHRSPLLACPHVTCDRVMGTASQLGGVPQRPCQVVSLKNVHDLLGRFHSSPPRDLAEFGWHRSAKPGRGPPPGNRRGTVKIVSGRSDGRHRAVSMSASGQLYGRLRAVSRGRRHPSRVRVLRSSTCRRRGVPPETQNRKAAPTGRCALSSVGDTASGNASTTEQIPPRELRRCHIKGGLRYRALLARRMADGNYGERRLARAVLCLGLPPTTAITPRPCTYGSELAGARLRGVRRWVRRHPREP
jgi:hypothetical protein